MITRSPGGSHGRLRGHGAELAFTYQGEALGKRVKPLANRSDRNSCCPATSRTSARRCASSQRSRKSWGTLDFLVHAIAFSDKNELKGRYADTTRENFSRTMVISCFSFTEVGEARGGADAERRLDGHADLWRLDAGDAELQRDGRRQGGAGSIGALSRRRFRPPAIRVNAISAGPIRTLAGAGIGDARAMFNFQQKHSPLGRSVTLEEIGGSALYLLSDLSTGVTGEIHYVDSGYNIISMPRTEEMRAAHEADAAQPQRDAAK